MNSITKPIMFLIFIIMLLWFINIVLIFIDYNRLNFFVQQGEVIVETTGFDSVAISKELSKLNSKYHNKFSYSIHEQDGKDYASSLIFDASIKHKNIYNRKSFDIKKRTLITNKQLEK